MDRPKEFDRELEAHYRKHAQSLVSMMAKGSARPIAQDIVQEAYTRALEQWETYDPQQTQFATWFGSKMLPQSRSNLVRIEKRHGMGMNAEDIDETDIDESRVSIPSDAETQFQVWEVLKRISKQPDHHRNVLHGVLVLGESYEEAVSDTGVTPKAARDIVYRFKREMQYEDRVR